LTDSSLSETDIWSRAAIPMKSDQSHHYHKYYYYYYYYYHYYKPIWAINHSLFWQHCL